MKKFTGLLIWILSLLLISCDSEEWNQKEGTNPNGFTLEYTVSSPLSAVTRSSIQTQEGEDKVNSLYILFFENSNDGSGLFLEAIDAKKVSSETLEATGNLQINYTENSTLNSSTDYKVLFCANIEEYTTLSIDNVEDIQNHFQGHSENEVVASLLLNVSGVSSEETGVLDYSNHVNSSNLPMSATAVKKAKNENLSVELVRTFSRFDVFCQRTGYELVSASIWNANTVGTLWGDPAVSGSSHTERYYGVKADQDKQIVGCLYAFENYVGEPTQNDPTTTCLIIGLHSTASGQVEYFRVNVHPDFMEQDLKRNNVYRSTVREVLGKGALTEREAYEGSESLLDIDINGWMLEDNENFYHDGTNILALPTKLIELFPYGDERTYNVYTLGEGSPVISHRDLPDNITVELTDNELVVKADPSSEPGEGIIKITFGKLTGSILIRQTFLERDFLDLSINKLPVFSHEVGELSEAIEVTSSGRWVAELYDGDYFAFSSENGPVITMTGESGDSFNVETIKANTDLTSRTCFVIVRLQDVPEVSRVILLEQEGYVIEDYVRFNPSYTIIVDGAGETISKVKLESNTEWELSFSSLHQTNLTFTDNGRKVSTLTGKGDRSLVINVPANNSSTNIALSYVVANIKGTNNRVNLILSQRPNTTSTPDPDPVPVPKESMLFIANGTGAGNLVSTTSNGYQQFVYVLGSTFRDTSKFGKKGNLVNLGKDGFQFSNSFTSSSIADAKVIQLLTNPSEADFDKIYKNMQADPNTFLMITSTSYTEVTNILKQFKAKTKAAYGSAVNVTNAAVNYRPMNSNINKNHPLVKYLMNGPGGKITSLSSVSLQSNQSTGAGLTSSAYPSTFVPIIMSNQNNTYCVFGIDPVNRLIIMTDPGIFGCYPTYSSYPSYGNYSYTGTHNWIFLNNFASWLVSATGINGFLKDYQK